MFRNVPIITRTSLLSSSCKLNRHFSNAIIIKVQNPNPSTFFQSGQPIHENRPELVKKGDITTGISAIEYYQRRLKLSMNMKSGSIAIIPGSNLKYASGSVFYKFQQNNDMYYLSGWNEADSFMIIEKRATSSNPDEDLDENVKFHLIVPPKDPQVEKWEGFRTGVEGAQEIFNADHAVSNTEFSSHLAGLLRTYKNVYYDLSDPKSGGSSSNNSLFSRVFGQSLNTSNQNKLSLENLLRDFNSNVYPLSPIICNLRVIKSNAELKIMQLAGRISGHGYNKTIAKLPSLKSEKELQLELDYQFQKLGCDGIAYIPVVAAHSNALCIHYTRNDQFFTKDKSEMVLIDASGSIGGYCSDISRTFPTSGKFTDPQRDLYEAVLNVEKGCIEKCTVSSGLSLHELHYESVRLMTKELRNCGFHYIQDWEVMKFLYPHYIGHNLGLDVHDVPSCPRNKPFQKGQVITVEPGVYVPDDDKWPKAFRNIGIRIEDDIAIGADVYVNLTKEAVKEIDDIEKIVQQGSYSCEFDETPIVSQLL